MNENELDRFAEESSLSVYPNPFQSVPTIQFELVEKGWGELRVYDYQMRPVLTVFEGMQEAGRHSVEFESGSLMAGVYFCRLQVGGGVRVVRMVVLP